MKHTFKKIGAALLAGALSLSILSACSSQEPSVSFTPADTSQTSEGENETEASVFEFPALGMTAALSDALIKRMNEDVTMVSNAFVNEDGTTLQYGVAAWYLVPAESVGEDGFILDSLQYAGVLGVYEAGLTDQLDELTGCDEHKEVGRSSDGAYVYYLSTNSKADPELTAAIGAAQVTITDMASIDISGEAPSDTPSSPASEASVGPFATEDVNGTSYTQDIFKDYDLTLVNIFTTWCSPCVAEMPELEELYQQLKDQGVGVVGVVLDVLDEKGEIIPDALSQARLLAERTGVTYPLLLPDSTYFNGRLIGIQAFPETFFVDRDGNIVGSTYSGSGDLEYWLSIVETELASLKESRP